MKTHELTGLALDWAVAKALGIKPLKLLEDENLPYCFDLFHDIKTLSEARAILSGEPHCSGLGSEELRKFATEMGYVIDRPVYPAYSTDWSQGGPIIERERIDVFSVANGKNGAPNLMCVAIAAMAQHHLSPPCAVFVQALERR